MKKINYQALLLFILTLFIFSCQTGEPESKVLYNNVMEIHDEVMPKMSKIHRLQKQLKKIDFEANPNIDKAVVDQHIKQLDIADEAMMNWMAKFKTPAEDANEQATVTYLKTEKENIENVKKTMLSSIQEASDFLAKSLPKQ